MMDDDPCLSFPSQQWLYSQMKSLYWQRCVTVRLLIFAVISESTWGHLMEKAMNLK